MDPSPKPSLEQSPTLREASHSPQNDGPSTSYESGQASPASFHPASPTSQIGNSPRPRRLSISPLRRQRSRSPPMRYQRSPSPSSYRSRGRGSRGRGRGRGRGGYRDEWAPPYRRDDDRPRGSFRGRADVYLGRRSRSPPPRRRPPSPGPRGSRYSPQPPPSRFRSPPPRRRYESPRRSSPSRRGYSSPPRRYDDHPRRYPGSPKRPMSSLPRRYDLPSRHASPNRDPPAPQTSGRSPARSVSPRRSEPDRRSPPRRSPDPGELRALRIRPSSPHERRKFPTERYASPRRISPARSIPRSPRSRSPSPNRRRSMLPPRRDPLYPLYDDRRARGSRGRPRGRGRGAPFDYDRGRPFRGRGRGSYRDDSRRSDEDRPRDSQSWEKSSPVLESDVPMDIDSKPESTVLDTTIQDNLEEGETDEISMQVDAPVSSLDETSETGPPPRAPSPPRAPRALLPQKPTQVVDPPERLRHAASISDRERQKLPDRPAGERGLPDRPRSDVEWPSNASDKSPHHVSTTHRPRETDEKSGMRDVDLGSPMASQVRRQSSPDNNLGELAREASSSKLLSLSIPSVSAVSDSTPVGTPRIDHSIMRFPTPVSSTTPRLASVPIPSGPRFSSGRGRGGAPNMLRLPYIHKYATNPRVKGTLNTINQTLKAIADLREQRRVLKAHLEGGVAVVNACVRVEEVPNNPKPIQIWQERVVWNGPNHDGPVTVFGAVDREKSEVNTFLTSLQSAPASNLEGTTREKMRADWEVELSMIELRAAEQRRSVAVRLMDMARLGRIGIDYNEGDTTHTT